MRTLSLRRMLLVLAVLLPVTTVTIGALPQSAQAAYAYTFGAEPYGDALAAAGNSARCGLSQMQLAALMLAPSYPETGASGLSAPSPMTLSRYDNQAALYAFSDKATIFPKAFWHPGLGVWAMDSAGGWDLTAAEAMNTDTAARPVAEEIAKRWCSYTGDPADHVARRKYAWGPWHGCAASRCETIYNAIFDPNGLKVNLDYSVSRGGGMQTRTCRLPDVGVVTCHLVDPSKAQGYKGFAIPAFGPSPVTSPFYVVRLGDKEQRWWLRDDSGYTSTISATKLVRVNARKMTPSPALTWGAGDGLCDLTVQKGACGTIGGTQPAEKFHEMSPRRVIDSRSESRVGPFATPWGSGETRNVELGGVAGVPADASAVVLNVTAVNPSASTHLRVWPAGEAKPATSNLNVPRGDIRANAVTVGLGANGMISLNNNFGSVHVVVDVVGWYSANGYGGAGYNPVMPARIWDTRSGPGKIGKVGTTETRWLTVTGVGGVPAGATAVVLNVTGVKPTQSTYMTVWPTGYQRPGASNLNVPAGDTRANLVVAKVGQDGTVSLYNHVGAVDLVVDVVGWFGQTGASFASISPTRLWDSRFGPGALGKMGTTDARELTVAGIAAVPADATVVVLNVTAVAPKASTYLNVWPAGHQKPGTSTLNVPGGDIRANSVMASVGAGGKVTVYNNFSDVDVVVDVVGWFR